MRRSQPEPQDDGNDSERDYAASTNNQLAIELAFDSLWLREIGLLMRQVECKLLKCWQAACLRDWNLVPLLSVRIPTVLSLSL